MVRLFPQEADSEEETEEEVPPSHSEEVEPERTMTTRMRDPTKSDPEEAREAEAAEEKMEKHTTSHVAGTEAEATETTTTGVNAVRKLLCLATQALTNSPTKK